MLFIAWQQVVNKAFVEDLKLSQTFIEFFPGDDTYIKKEWEIKLLRSQNTKDLKEENLVGGNGLT